MRKRGVIYARYSSHNQRSESTEIQIEKVSAFFEEQGIELVGIYSDEAKTGKNTNRSDFQRMLADAKKGAFDYVGIYKVTRIMRNRDEMAMARIMLRKCGVEILYAGEDIAEGSTGILQLGMLEVLAEWESAIDSERIRDGIQKNASRCMANGRTLMGWDIVDGYYQVNDAERRALANAKDMVLRGESVEEAARKFPLLSRRGKKIDGRALGKLLRRKQNAGIYSYAGHEKEGGMPALWSMEEQEMLWRKLGNGTKPRNRHYDVRFSLTGKLYHGECDEPMTGTSGTGKSGRQYFYYQCRGCGMRVRKESMEASVAAGVLELLSDPARRERIADLLCEYEGEREAVKQSDIIKSELSEIEVTFDRIWRAIEEGIAPPGGKERVANLQERQKLLEEELKVARKVEAVAMDRDRVLYWLENIAGTTDDQTLIELFVYRVVLHGDDDLEITLTFEDDVGGGVLVNSPRVHQKHSGAAHRGPLYSGTSQVPRAFRSSGFVWKNICKVGNTLRKSMQSWKNTKRIYAKSEIRHCPGVQTFQKRKAYTSYIQ